MDETTAPVPRPLRRGRAATRINLASALGTVLGVYGAPGSILLTLFLLEWLRADKWQIGLVLTMMYLGPTFEPLGAYLAERLGRRRSLFLTGFLVNRVPFFVMGGIPFIGQAHRVLSILIILAVVAVTRVGAALGTPAWWSWVGDLVPERRRARFFGCRAQCAGAMTATSLVVGLALLEMCGGLANRWLVSLLFSAGAAFGTLDILLYLGVQEPPPRGKVQPTAAAPFPQALIHHLRAPFAARSFRRLILGMGLWSFSANLVVPFIPVYQRGECLAGQRLGLGISFLSLAGLNVLASLATMLTARRWGNWGPRLGPRVLLLVGSGYLFVNLAYWLVGPASMAALVPISLAAGALAGAWTVVTNQLLLATAPRENRSYFVSAYNLTNGWLMAGGPLLGGLLADRLPFLGWSLPGGLPCCYFHLLVLLACLGGAGALVLLSGSPALGMESSPEPTPEGRVVYARLSLETNGLTVRKQEGITELGRIATNTQERQTSCPSQS
jgi:MFS family permease